MRIAQIRLLVIGLLSCWFLASCTPNTHEQMVMAQQNYLSKHYKVSFGQVQSAARMGDPDAQYALGYMFYYGKGTPQDTRLGTYWIKRAAAQGQPQAQQALQILSNVKQPPTVPDDSTPFFDDSKAIQTSKAESAARNKATHISSTSRSTRRLVKPITLPKSIAARDEPVTRQVTPITQVTDDSLTPINVDNKKQVPISAGSARHYTVAERKLLAASNSDYTLQLLDVRQENEALSFIRKHGLQAKASYYCAYRDGRPMYIVVYGQYDSTKQARAAIKTLPDKVQQLGPWVKSLAKVQRDLRS